MFKKSNNAFDLQESDGIAETCARSEFVRYTERSNNQSKQRDWLSIRR